MRTYVALLRGINVGKAKRIRMADLRGWLAAMGYSEVATLLNSGNVVFRARGGDSRKHATQISAAILREAGFDVPVIVLSSDDLAAIVAECPFAVEEAQHPRLLVAFVQDASILPALDAASALATPPEAFAVTGRAAYLHCASGILESRAAEALLGKAGRGATTRNWATVLKLHALAAR